MDAVPPSVLEQFRTLFAQRTGIVLQGDDGARIKRFLHDRLKRLHLRQGDAYLRLLQENTPRAGNEWRIMVTELTVLESFFFRDRGQHEVLRNHLLPGMIREKRDTRELRIWSAGCSRGEEIYSIAILLHELLPARREWRLRLVGTDINPAAIEMARNAVYSRWSLRNLDARTTERYFRRSGDRWRLDPGIAGMVDFRTGNLLTDEFPEHHGMLHDMDLILCRNVFIYMNADDVGRIVQKLHRTLRQGGVLLTGHSELQGVRKEGLVSQHLPGSTVHIRRPVPKTRQPKARIPATPPPPAHRPRAKKSEHHAAPRQPDIRDAERLFEKGEYRRAIDTLERLSPSARQQPHARRLEARIHLQLDDLKAAREAVEALLETSGNSAEDLFLLALIQETGNRTARAMKTLNQALYLDPGLVAAYVHLALLWEIRGDPGKARRLRMAALDRLQGLPAEASVPHFDGRTAAELVDQLTGALERTAATGDIGHV